MRSLNRCEGDKWSRHVSLLGKGRYCNPPFVRLALSTQEPLDKKWVHIITTILAVFIGIAFIKTVVECNLYAIPFEIKFPKNTVAFIADTIPMLIGLFLGYRLKPLYVKILGLTVK